MITIKTMPNEWPKHPWQIRVDRPTILSNPYFAYQIDKHPDAREEVCDAYEEHFKQMTDQLCPETAAFIAELKRLESLYKQYGELELFYQRAPKRCHAETIKKHLEEALRL